MFSKRFTPSNVLRAIDVDDNMIQMVGYIDNICGKTKATNGSDVMRIVLNNNDDHRVQVVAWGRQIEKLEPIATDIGVILKIEGASAQKLPGFSRYNDGNVNFNLQIKDQTTIKVLGMMDKKEKLEAPIVEVTFDTITEYSGFIKITGFIQVNFRLLESKYQSIGLGSITDGIKKLEIQIKQFNEDDFDIYHVGHKISVIGVLTRRGNSPSYLLVTDSSKITKISNNKTSLETILSGVEYIE